MPLPRRCDALRDAAPWRLARVLGDWRGRTLYRDLAWVSPRGDIAVSVRAWGGGTWDDSELAWTVLDLRDGEALAHGRVALSQDPVIELAFDDDGASVLALDAEERVFRVTFARASVTQGFAPPRWDAQRARVETVQPSLPDLTLWGIDAGGRWALASELHAQTLTLVDLRSGTRTSWHTGHATSVASLAFSADGGTLASSAQWELVRVWSLEDGGCAWTFEPRAPGAVALRFDGDGRGLSAWPLPTPGAVAGEGALQRWSLADGEERVAVRLTGDEGESGGGTLSPEGDVLARLLPSGRGFTLRRVADPHPRAPVRRVPFAMRAATLRFVDGGRSLRVLGVDGARWCVGEVDVAASFEADGVAIPRGPLRALEVSQEFGECYVADDGSSALLPDGAGLRWCDLDTGEAGRSVPRGVDAPESAVAVAVHPRRVAFARDAAVELWDSSGRREALIDLAPLHDLVSALTFDPAGEQLAVGTALGVVLVYRRDG